jgi:PKD repeat protein
MRSMIRHVRRPFRPRRPLGQSLAEFAIALPVLLLLMLIGLDFGRVYLGWVNLQNMARIAANYASSNPTAWVAPDDPIKQNIRATYANQVRNDAKATNCTLPVVSGVSVVPDPTFPTGSDIGDTASVSISCSFGVITPIISNAVGRVVTVSAASTFPIRTGLISPGAGPSVPGSAFTAMPTTLSTGQTVVFTDTSTGGPTAWSWDFDGNGTTDSTIQNPSFTYNTAGSFQACLVAGNAAGFDATPFCVAINVSSPGTVDFVGAPPLTGNGTLTVQFTDQSTAGGTAWAWDFDNNGTVDDTTQNPSHTFSTGVYDVKLTVTYPTGTAFLVKNGYVNVGAAVCTVPDFSNTSTTGAQALWQSRGFTTTVQYKQGNLPWTIVSQTITGGQNVLCSSTIRVSKTSTP